MNLKNLLFADGFNEAIIGLGRKKGCSESIVYDYEKCVDILIKRDEMQHEEAVEFMEYNVVDAYVGENTPIFVLRGFEL